MFNSSIAQVALAAVGALVFSMTAVAAAVGPARLAETTPVVYADAASLVEGAGHA